ncbi:hypothetical protein NMK71_01650 [Weeksellaceae bacterium KMM 9713]|uniref:Uncharacterized protein n=1 Tax=Profundicola chukchiensis TaxID=2961959 RepID=A0A9X4RTY3_9FLAO|nr:hypothetical protein [Profundicola chukchiensis]MDG4945106.1 hypothetical protein [Profundicola chukchiensis]
MIENEENNEKENVNTSELETVSYFVKAIVIVGILIWLPFSYSSSTWYFNFSAFFLLLALNFLLALLATMYYDPNVKLSRILNGPFSFIDSLLKNFINESFTISKPENPEEESTFNFVFTIFILTIAVLFTLYILFIITSILGILLDHWYYTLSFLLIVGGISTFIKRNKPIYNIALALAIIATIYTLYDFRHESMFTQLKDYFLNEAILNRHPYDDAEDDDYYYEDDDY